LSLLKLGLSLKSNKVVNKEDRWSWYTYFKQSSQIGLLKKPWFLGSLWSISRFEKLSTTVYISATVQLLMCSIMLYRHWRHALRRYGDWVFRQPNFNLKCEIPWLQSAVAEWIFSFKFRVMGLSRSDPWSWRHLLQIHPVPRNEASN
jgi:hypothetical protein